MLDLGCGTGQISIPMAEPGANVLGIDVSPAMANALLAEAHRRPVWRSLTGSRLPIEELELAPASVDLVVSSYALHHLRDADKARLVTAAFEWLRPGGRLVIADMMLGRGGSARDRAIIRGKLRVLARKGPGGWWRIVKNSWRYLVRVQERPISIASLDNFVRARPASPAITASALVAEAGLVTGARPDPGRTASKAMAGAANSSERR